MLIPNVLTRWPRVSVGVLVAGWLVLGGGAKTTAASVVYDFDLAANGEVGAISIQLTFADFLPISGFDPVLFNLTAPEVTTFSSGTPIDPTSSLIGINVTAAQTLIGFFLSSANGETVLLTIDYPADFFSFGRSPDQTGTVLSSTGQVLSDFELTTAMPTATLVVSSVVPEPATVALLGLGVLGAVAWHRRRRTIA